MFSSIQSIPGLIFARSDVKAKIRPGVEAKEYPRKNWGQLHTILYMKYTTTPTKSYFPLFLVNPVTTDKLVVKSMKLGKLKCMPPQG